MKIPTPPATGEELLTLHGNKGEEETKKTEDPQRSHIFAFGKNHRGWMMLTGIGKYPARPGYV